MLKRWWVYLLFGLPGTASADKEDSALLECYKTNETHVEVTACLDNHWKVIQGALEEAQASLDVHLKALDEISSAEAATPLAIRANRTFEDWREQQCKMVEASFASGSGSGQGYLTCMIDLTREQITRLNDLMGKRGVVK